jgi:glycosyltransferase involved in cell wall biosynthesis
MRISYWCGWLEPEMVAVSKEVFQLMEYFPRSCAFGLGRCHSFSFSMQRRSVGVHTSAYPLVKPLFPFIERRFDVSHVYTSLGDWHYLNGLGQRPIVLTLTERSAPTAPELLAKVSHVAAESAALAETAIGAGVPEERISIVYPGVDLAKFHVAPPPACGPWKMLFASSPENLHEIATKGLDLLLDLAAVEPDLELTVLWRPFGRGSDQARAVVERRALSNVRIISGKLPDIERYFRSSHFVAAPFRTVGKPCPNSILEALACGRPVLLSDFVDIGELIEEHQAGIRFTPTLDDLRRAYRRMCEQYSLLQPNARQCAEQHFDLEQTRRAYETIYRRLVQNGAPCGGIAP